MKKEDKMATKILKLDDINLISNSVAGAQSLLSRCSVALNWEGMSYRTDKSRSIVIIKGKSLNCTPFTTQEDPDPIDFSSFIPSK